MLSLPELVQIHFCMQPTDMRKGFDSLAALAMLPLVLREGWEALEEARE